MLTAAAAGHSQAMMGYGGHPHPPMYGRSSHVSPGDSGINTKAPSLVADGDLEREDMMDQKRVYMCVCVCVCARACVTDWCEPVMLVFPLFLCSTTCRHK